MERRGQDEVWWIGKCLVHSKWGLSTVNSLNKSVDSSIILLPIQYLHNKCSMKERKNTHCVVVALLLAKKIRLHLVSTVIKAQLKTKKNERKNEKNR